MNVQGLGLYRCDRSGLGAAAAHTRGHARGGGFCVQPNTTQGEGWANAQPYTQHLNPQPLISDPEHLPIQKSLNTQHQIQATLTDAIGAAPVLRRRTPGDTLAEFSASVPRPSSAVSSVCCLSCTACVRIKLLAPNNKPSTSQNKQEYQTPHT